MRKSGKEALHHAYGYLACYLPALLTCASTAEKRGSYSCQNESHCYFSHGVVSFFLVGDGDART
jgi:hypothetical protein